MSEIRGLSFRADADDPRAIVLDAALGLELLLMRVDDVVAIGIWDGEEVRGVAIAPEQIDDTIAQLQGLRDRATAAVKRRLQ